MKFIHLSDLHLGKRVYEYSMIEDQKYILNSIIDIIEKEKINGVIIAGDIYDKSVPSAEAVEVFDSFLCRLMSRKLQVFVISGNHDSPERLAFGARIMDESGIHISRVFNGEVVPFKMEDKYGYVNIYMLPFIKPIHIRNAFENAEVMSYSEAMGYVIEKMNINTNERNILVTHQFVTGATRSESEEISVGGSDNVDAFVFNGFDYVALGHIHSPQNCGSNTVRYCGTPLKYSFSESKDNKSVTVVEIKEKGEISVKTVPLIPLRDLVELKGTYEELTLKSFYDNTSWQEDYVHITLTDEEDIPDAIGKLRTIYHNLMKLDYDNKRTKKNSVVNCTDEVENKTPFDLFSELYYIQNNQQMSEKQANFIKQLIEKVWEGRQ